MNLFYWEFAQQHLQSWNIIMNLILQSNQQLWFDMQSLQTSRRDLLISQPHVLGQAISIENSYLICQKENTKNSVDSERSPSFKPIYGLDPKLQNAKAPLPKIQPTLSRRKILQQQLPDVFIYIKQQPKSPQVESVQADNKGICFYKFFKRDGLIRRFIQKLQKESYILPQQLKHKLHSDSYFTSLQKQKLLDTAQEVDPESFLISSNTFLLVWDLAAMMNNLVCSWFQFFYFAFFQEEMNVLPLQIIILCFACADAFMDSKRAAFIQGEVITSSKQILQVYKTMQAPQDGIYILALLLNTISIADYQVGNIILTILIVYISLKKAYKKYANFIDSLFLSGSTNNAYYDLCTLIVVIVYFAHAMACIWYYIGNNTAQREEGSWLRKYNIVELNLIGKYNSSFYWATVTMVTVGYGDITPQNQLEMLFASVLMICSSCMYAYSMTSIGIIVKNLYDQETHYKRSMIQINSYMAKNAVKMCIQNKIRNHLKYQLQKEKEEKTPEGLERLKQMLPKPLCDELQEDVNLNHVRKMKLLSSLFDQQSIEKLSHHISECSYTPGEVIYAKNAESEDSLYFIQKGEVCLGETQGQRLLQKYASGETFGEYQFFTGDCPKIGAFTNTYTTVIKVNRMAFLSIIRANDKDWEVFHNIKDEILFKNNFQQLKIKCDICGQFSHQTIGCNYIQYFPNFEQRYKRFYFEPSQNQRQRVTRQGEKMNSLMLLEMMQASLQQFNEKQNQGQNQHQMWIGKSTVFQQQEVQTPEKLERLDRLDRTVSYERITKKHMSHMYGGLRQRNSIALFQQEQNVKSIAQLAQNFFSYDIIGEGPSLEIDRQRSYQYYMPWNNVENVSEVTQSKFAMHLMNKEQLAKFKGCTKYTFNIKAIQMVVRIYEKLQKKKKPVMIMNLLSKKLKK